MNDAATKVDPLIAVSSGIKNGTPHIAGAGILVRTIVRWYQSGLAPEEIATRHEGLRLDHVHAALAYYYAHRGDVDADLQRQDEEALRLESAHRPHAVVA